jgi:hypothetical protein
LAALTTLGGAAGGRIGHYIGALQNPIDDKNEKLSSKNKLVVASLNQNAMDTLARLRSLPQGINLREVATGSAKPPRFTRATPKLNYSGTNIKGARVNNLIPTGKKVDI